MLFWTRITGRDRGRRSRPLAVEAMEGRALMSAVPVAHGLTPHPSQAEVSLRVREDRAAILETRAARLNIRSERLAAHQSAPTPIGSVGSATDAQGGDGLTPTPMQAKAARLQLRAARLNIRSARLATMKPGTAGADATTPTVGEGGQFAISTAWNGFKITHNLNNVKLGLNYGKLAIAHDTRKVGAAYIHAAIKGDGKTLTQLGKTHIVKKVGDDFVRLSHSAQVKYVGNQFSHFGKSVANQFNRLIGQKTRYH